MSANRSPLPWAIRLAYPRHVQGADGKAVAVFGDHADAEFVVDAANTIDGLYTQIQTSTAIAATRETQFTAAREMRDDLLAACKEQNKAIDILLAALISADKTFLPTKSVVWPMLLQGNAAIAKAEGRSP